MHPIFLFSGVLTLLYLYLTWQVIRRRYAYNAPYGAPNDDMQKAIRAHGNFSEYVPLFLILLELEDIVLQHMAICYVAGTVFTFGRISHAYSVFVVEPKGLAQGWPKKQVFRFRFMGMVATFFTLAALACILLVQYLLAVLTA